MSIITRIAATNMVKVIERITQLYEAGVPTGEIARMVVVPEAVVVKVIAKYDPCWAERKGY